MIFIKEHHEEYPYFEFVKHLTERTICYALESKGIKNNRDFKLHQKIGDIPFNKKRKHEVDIVLISHNGSKLYVEIKGQMTYIEVNKLRYLHLPEVPYNFYILQLTEIDWIEPYDNAKHKSMPRKSRSDFEKQIGELVAFVNGTITGEELAERSKKRLADFIEYRENDLEIWKALQRKS